MNNRVMIVDDDKELLQELKEYMCSSGFEVSAFSDGDTALSMVPKLNPDIILLDLKMDKMSGFQVADLLRSQFKGSEIPVIAMTGYYTQEEYRMLMRICGIKKCILKPVDPKSLVRDVRNILSTAEGDDDEEKN